MDAPPIAVVDVETTGFSKHDRICEIAIINLSGDTLEPKGEFTSLVNPQRDTGPVWIHGISNEMVEQAPRFSQIQQEVAERIDGHVLVAHNLAFDQRMLKQEWSRLNGNFYPGDGICTLKMTGEKLVCAARHHKVRFDHAHSALGDARTAAELFAVLDSERSWSQPAIVIQGLPPIQLPALPREMSHPIEQSTLAGLIADVSFPSDNEKILSYLDNLSDALEDLVLTHEEAFELEQVRQALELSNNDVAEAHQTYFSAIIEAANADRVIDAAEHRVLTTIATIINCDPAAIPKVSDDSALILRETRVCATGSAHDIDGKPITREDFHARCQAKGIIHVSTVTQHCDILVADSVNTQSVKGNRARDYGIPILSYEEFITEYEV